MRTLALVLAAFVAAGGASSAQAQTQAQAVVAGHAVGHTPATDGTVVVWIVRHAERADQQRMGAGAVAMQADPELSEEGVRRARHLAGMLAEAGITQIHSTAYRRTEATAEPLALRLGIPVSTYDVRGPEAGVDFARRLRAAPGRHLVVGHSNTVPALVEALGVDPQGTIADDEYDRLYQVVIGADGSVTGTLLRYGPGA